MERLTKWNEQTEQAELLSWDEKEWKDFMGSLDVPIATELSISINKLAEYEDAEEQGLLVRLPCNIGDIVFEASRTWKSALERNVASIAIYKNSIWIRNGCGDSFEYGVEVFLTKEEAEKALERMVEDEFNAMQ